MEQYITHSLRTYSPKNKKWMDIIEFIQPFNNIIIPDRLSLDAFINTVEHKISHLNRLYPKTKPLKLSFDHEQLRVSHITNGCPEEAFILHINKVRGIFQFAENSSKQLTETTETSEITTYLPY
jgi:hypothetical protein